MELIQAIFALYRERGGWFLGLLWDHFLLSGQAILLSGSIGLLLGIFIAQRPRLAPAVMGVCNVLYTIPAISLLGILIPFTGIGNKTAVIAGDPGGCAEHGGDDRVRGGHRLLCGGRWAGRVHLPGHHHL